MHEDMPRAPLHLISSLLPLSDENLDHSTSLLKSYTAAYVTQIPYDRTVKGDVHYRFVIEMKSL